MLHTRPGRRRLTRAAALAVAALALSSCGFDNATDAVYIAGSGNDAREGSLDVLNAVIVSAQDGSGTFVASFANNSLEEADEVLGITAGGDQAGLQVDLPGSIEVPPGGLVNAVDEEPITVTGDFDLGDFVTLRIDVAEGDDIEIDVPVVADTDQFDGLDTSGSSS